MVKDIKKYDFDVAVIGAGPAGMMAAGTAASLGLKVALIEKNSAPAKKLLLTGNGRCNLTNAETNLRELVKKYNNGEFLFHIFSVFGPEQTIKFFEKLGVKTKVEKDKRVFPVSNEAGEVLEALNKFLLEHKVDVFFNSEIIDIKKVGKKISKIVLKKVDGESEITAEKYILCTGGKAHPTTGSDGIGYQLAEKLGHTIIKPMPALTPIELQEAWIKNVQGISLKDININVFQNGKKKISEAGEFIFTHFGISGPAVLNVSGDVGELLKTGGVKISFDLFPSLNQEELIKKINGIFNRYSSQISKNILSNLIPERLAEVALDISGVAKNKIGNSTSRIEREKIVKTVKNFEVTVKDVYSFSQALVTRGGISLDEIDHTTMKSKLINNLFFAGEIINVDGKSGGYNLQMCWSTGYLASKSTAD